MYVNIVHNILLSGIINIKDAVLNYSQYNFDYFSPLLVKC